jgi:hypothetical protein
LPRLKIPLFVLFSGEKMQEVPETKACSVLHDLFFSSDHVRLFNIRRQDTPLGANLQGYRSNQPMVVGTWRFDFLHLDISHGVAAALG